MNYQNFCFAQCSEFQNSIWKIFQINTIQAKQDYQTSKKDIVYKSYIHAQFVIVLSSHFQNNVFTVHFTGNDSCLVVFEKPFENNHVA